jgi:hypothetical protein
MAVLLGNCDETGYGFSPEAFAYLLSSYLALVLAKDFPSPVNSLLCHK